MTRRLRFGLRDMPIRKKVILVVLLTTSVAIITAGFGIIAADAFFFKRSLTNDLSALSQIISENLTASLSFDDPAAAGETLRTLRARTHVVVACVFKPDGTLFAKYARGNAQDGCSGPAKRDGIEFRTGVAAVSRGVFLGQNRLGSLVLVYDLSESAQRVELFGATVFAVLLFSTAIALLLSGRLRSLLTDPILELATISARVSESRAYHLRARKFSSDELGLLVDRFNEMLASIQSRDVELHKALLARGAALHDAQEARESLEVTLKNVATLNEELRKSNDRLARSNEDLERFAFIASHDLQEPLRMITIHTQLLARKYTHLFDARAVEWMKNVENGATRMSNLLADLLAYAEIGAPSETPANRIDLNAVVQKSLENLALSIKQTNATISIDQLPVIMARESHFIPLFQNLIGNALKYRSEQSPEINVGAISKNGHAEIFVSDNGIGIAPEFYSKIFVPFKRLHGQKIPGTGIGLAICQRIVEKYGGSIWVDSVVGQGSTFRFTLPVTVLATDLVGRDRSS